MICIGIEEIIKMQVTWKKRGFYEKEIVKLYKNIFVFAPVFSGGFWILYHGEGTSF